MGIVRWLLILLAGCNLVYGLDETSVAPPDPDGDRKYGADDNCPDDSNSDQADEDRDGVGDACDTCLGLHDPTNHDEDGDHVGDLCDGCETVPDFQSDLDDDGVTDQCDEVVQNGARSARLVFDAFRAIDATRWTTTSTWTEHGDSVSATPEGTLVLAEGRVEAPYWNIDLGIESPTEWTAGDRFGVRLVEAGVVTMRCEVQCAPTCELVAENAGVQQVRPISKSRPIVQLRALVAPNGTVGSFSCGMLFIAAGFISPTTSTRGDLEVVVGGQIELAYIGAWTHEL